MSLLLLMLLLVSPAGLAHQVVAEKENKFQLSMFVAPDTRQVQMMELVYQELFRRLGMEVDIEVFPLKRASVQANTGKIDGEAARIATYSEMHTNMLLVDIPVVQVVFVAYARKKDQITLKDGWADLVNSLYRIGYVRGIVFSERSLRNKISPVRLSYAKSVRQGLLKLLYGRTDLFVHARGDYLEDEGLDEHLAEVSVIGVVPLYMHVHESHKALVPQIKQVLSEMKADGWLLKTCRQVYRHVADRHCFPEDNPYSQLQW